MFLTDQQLITQAQGGNSEAFGRLVQRYQGRLFDNICYLVRSPVDAEEVVQDVFVQAYLKLGAFQQRCALYTWLYRIARNLLHSRSRQRRVRACLSHAWPLNEDQYADPHGTPYEELQRREDAVHIGEAFRALTEEHRTILVLRGIKGFDYVTIAEVLGLNVGTVRSRLHRARRELRDQLEQRRVCRA